MPKRDSKNERNARGYRQRKTNQRNPRKNCLIYCQGEKTEPNYFKKFGSNWLTIRFEKINKDPEYIVNQAIRMKQGETNHFDATWCVFDKDDTENKAFDKAIQNARNNGIKVAYSNECFELWFVLHFIYLNTANPRNYYFSKLSDFLNCPYDKVSTNMYDRLIDKVDIAIKNSEKLMELHSPNSPSLSNPSTTVHELVKFLIENGKPLY